jgi:hypothetical protein
MRYQPGEGFIQKGDSFRFPSLGWAQKQLMEDIQ